ncbi:MAG TPA: putative glycoside hydrolase, partial [Dehalococcoidia bacterium]|nr:putative glycoside hydrolase [Dehalococcoidia bacterium]
MASVMRRVLNVAMGVALLAGMSVGLAPASEAVVVDGSGVAEWQAQRPADGAPTPVARTSLRGLVLGRKDGRIVRVSGAHVGTGETSIQTNANGRFYLAAAARTNSVSVVAPGYEVKRLTPTGRYLVVFLQPLEVRAIYIPFGELKRQEVLDWALGLARNSTITSLVIDVKDEGGSVLPQVATQTAREIGAVHDPGTDIEAFLTELEDLGVYRIARVVAFLDGRFAYSFPSEAILTAAGEIFVDDIGFVWTNPFSEAVRRHNVEVGVAATAWFEEIQYDYVRFPTDPGVVVRNNATPEQRSAVITQFAQDASIAIHAAGSAIAIDTFGQTTMIFHDGGIGQVLEDLAPFLDYYSPMVYPSTWTTGWFDLVYPPSDPFRVVARSVAQAVERLAPFDIVVRPWLQDFHDYQAQKLFYGPAQVRVQIDASAQAGGSGFMLWDPSLNYQTG